MTLLARVKKALEGLQEPFAVHDSFERLTVGERQVLNACIEAIRHLFAQPPTDEEVERALTAYTKAMGWPLLSINPAMYRAMRAAITADRGIGK